MLASSAFGSHIPARLAAATALAAALLTGAGPATASPPDPLEYVALGDSYAAGVGAGQYVSACGVSPLGYPERLDQRRSIDLVANPSCGGATTEDLISGGTLPAQILALNADTDLVTVTIGGNDVGFGEIAAACSTTPGTPQCAAAVQQALQRTATELPSDLAVAFGAIRQAAPNAHVIVTGYPQLFSPKFDRTGTSNQGAEVLNAGVDQLNSVIENVALSAGFQYIDVTDEFRNHGVGAPESWIRPDGPVVFHPTAEGYKKGYLHALVSEVQVNKLQMVFAGL